MSSKNYLKRKYIPSYVLNLKSIDVIISKFNTAKKRKKLTDTNIKVVNTILDSIDNMIEFLYHTVDIYVYKYDYFDLEYNFKNSSLIDKVLKLQN
jgi:hypothetical protein